MTNFSLIASSFEFLAGSASILALLIMLAGFASRLYRRYRQARTAADDAFDKEIERLNAAGTTVSGRTDLGFFVIIQLTDLTDTIEYFRSERLLFFTFAVFTFLAAFAMNQTTTNRSITELRSAVGLPAEPPIIPVPGPNVTPTQYRAVAVWSTFALCLLTVCNFLVGLLCHILFFLSLRHMQRFRRRIQCVWEAPIERRSKTAG